MRRVYIAHALKGDWSGGITAIKQFAMLAALRGLMPIAPCVLMDGLLDDEKEEDREMGMTLDLAQLANCDEVWLCGPRISDGMQREALLAETLGLVVRRFEWPSEIPRVVE